MAESSPRPNPAEIAVWPDCITPDCANKSCASLNSKWCHPCTMRLGTEAVGSAPVGYFDKFREAQREAHLRDTIFRLAEQVAREGRGE